MPPGGKESKEACLGKKHSFGYRTCHYGQVFLFIKNGDDKRGNGMKRVIATMTVLLAVLGMTVVAGDGKSDAVLKMETCSIENGAVDLAVDGQIDMKFSNNVVNLKVKDNNMTCFHLYDSTGAEVAIEVIMGDDQVDTSVKNDISVKPTASLAAGESYKLVVAQSLMSKNGNAMAEDVTIAFTTAGGEEEDNDTVILASGVATLFVGIAVLMFYKKKKSQA